jgi:hypothetical protein
MDTTEARPILAAAEAAAAVSDYATAERLLREAAAVQERTLGSAHPDLANTFNNLGVVCERAGKIDEAEASYRRAHAIATSAFPADHPFVETSRQNLEEFCVANGRPIDSPASASDRSVEHVDAGSNEMVAPLHATESPDKSQESASEPAPMRLQLDPPMPAGAGPTEQGPADAPPARAAEPMHTAERVPVSPRGPDRSSSALPLGALAVLVASFVIVFVGLMAWSSRTSNEAPSETEPPTTTAPPPPDTSAAPPPADTTAAPPSTPSPRATTSAPAAAARSRETSTASIGGITVTDARLCRTLTTRGDWECAPLGNPAAPGTMFFYTRIVSAGPTTVEHRWYFDDRLEQSVTLDVQPNSGGYRTFSRRTSNARRAGAWRVELRRADGQLLREERFTVSK